MDYKVLYRKYRPNDFSSIIGQDYMVSILRNSIKKDRISHAYIFSGPRGTGKTSTAKVFAKSINCQNPTENGPCNKCESCIHFKENADIIEIDAASNNGVDEIREIINNIKLAPAYSKYKVYIIDEVHMLSTSAFNALLLTLEEPPKHIVFILATTNIEAVPITILSRCQRFDFHKISIDDIKKRLQYVTSEEHISIDDDALEEIAYISDGGMRDALSILDQLSSNNERISIAEVMSNFGMVSKKQINDLFMCILNNDVSKFIDIISKLKSLAIDYKFLIKKLLERIEEEAINSRKNRDYQGFKYNIIKEMAFELASISNYVNINIDPYLLIEITLLKYFSNNEIRNENVDSNLEIQPKIQEEIISQEIISPSEPKEQKNQENKSEIISREIISSSPPKDLKSTFDPELIKIRINNCFANAKKEFLQTAKIKWSNLVATIQDKSLLSLIIDASIVASSDKVIIITHQLESTVKLINEHLEEISQEYKNMFNEDYQFIALTVIEWNREKQTYIVNLQNKIEYQYQEEPLSTKDLKEETTDNIVSVALDIFDKEKVEIE